MFEGKLITLWDIMKTLDKQTFLLIYVAVERIREQHEGVVIAKPLKEFYCSTFASAEKWCLDMNMQASAKACSRLKELLSIPGVSYTNVRGFIDDLESRLADEMMSTLLFYVEPRKQKYLGESLIGEAVVSAFPSAEEEIRNAGRCLAFDQWTASVFHSMRVLEIGLNALAKDLGVQFEQRNWENIINDIEAKIKSIKGTNKKGWKEKEQFYSEAALEFRYFKNAWRNHVMHVRAIYDEEKTEKIFEHTIQFMADLATKLKE